MNPPDDGAARVAATLKIIHLAMAGGLVLLGCVVAFLYSKGTPAAGSQAAMPLFSILTALMTAALWPASTFLFGLLSRPGTVEAVQGAYIVRAAMREGPALMGLVACLMGAGNGALRDQPAYWANALPALLFVGWVLSFLPDEHAVRARLLDGSTQKR